MIIFTKASVTWLLVLFRGEMEVAGCILCRMLSEDSQSNTRKYFWTGTIVTKGGMTYEFGAKEIVKGSGIFQAVLWEYGD